MFYDIIPMRLGEIHESCKHFKYQTYLTGLMRKKSNIKQVLAQ